MKTGAAPESDASSTATGAGQSPCLQHQPGLVWSNSESLDLVTPELLGLAFSSSGCCFAESLLLPGVFRPLAAHGKDAFLLLLQ